MELAYSLDKDCDCPLRYHYLQAEPSPNYNSEVCFVALELNLV